MAIPSLGGSPLSMQNIPMMTPNVQGQPITAVSTPKTVTPGKILSSQNSTPAKMSVQDFAKKIKTKYPVYGSMDDNELAKKIIDKYPVYAEQVDFGTPMQGGLRRGSSTFSSLEGTAFEGLEPVNKIANNFNPLGKATEIIDDKVQQIPVVSLDKMKGILKGTPFEGMEVLPTMAANTPGSLAKVATATARGINNPLDTIIGLTKLIATEEGRQVIKDRYGSIEGLKKTMVEDPVGLASDVLTLVQGGAALTSKVAKLGGATNLADEASRISNTAGAAADLGIPTLVKGVTDKVRSTNLGKVPNAVIDTIIGITEPLQSAGRLYEKAKDLQPTEFLAKKMLGVTSDQDKLFKAQEARTGQLNKSIDYRKLRENSDIANEEIVKQGYQPNDTATRAEAHANTMQRIRDNEIKARIGAEYDIELTNVADVIDEFVAKQQDAGLVKNQSQLIELQKQAQKFRDMGNVDGAKGEFIKEMINAQINNWGDSSIGDIYKNGMKEATRVLGLNLDDAFSRIPGEFQEAKRRFGALKATYADVVKADLKNQKSKGLGLTETFSRIEGFGDIVGGVFGTLGGKNPIPDILKGGTKLIVGKVLQKLKDNDFLIKEGFEGLGAKGLSKSQVLKAPTNRKGLPLLDGSMQFGQPLARMGNTGPTKTRQVIETGMENVRQPINSSLKALGPTTEAPKVEIPQKTGLSNIEVGISDVKIHGDDGDIFYISKTIESGIAKGKSAQEIKEQVIRYIANKEGLREMTTVGKEGLGSFIEKSSSGEITDTFENYVKNIGGTKPATTEGLIPRSLPGYIGEKPTGKGLPVKDTPTPTKQPVSLKPQEKQAVLEGRDTGVKVISKIKDFQDFATTYNRKEEFVKDFTKARQGDPFEPGFMKGREIDKALLSTQLDSVSKGKTSIEEAMGDFREEANKKTLPLKDTGITTKDVSKGLPLKETPQLPSKTAGNGKQMSKETGLVEKADSTLTSSIEKAKAEGKTFDEFVDSQGKKVYHFTDASFDEVDFGKSKFGDVGRGLYTTDNIKNNKWGKNMKTFTINKDAKVRDVDNISDAQVKEYFDAESKLLGKTVKPNKKMLQDYPAVIVQAIDKGIIDGDIVVVNSKSGGRNYIIKNKDAVKTEAQLRTEWDKLDNVGLPKKPTTPPKGMETPTSSIEKAKSEGKTFEEFMESEGLVYHGTPSTFDKFKSGKGDNLGSKLGEGTYFTKNKKLAENIGKEGNVYITDIRNKNILDLNSDLYTKASDGRIDINVPDRVKQVIKKMGITEDEFVNMTTKSVNSEKVNKILREAGYDGVKRGNVDILIFDPSDLPVKTTSQLRTERDKLDNAGLPKKTPTPPKGMETLYEEARKYKSAEDFVKNIKELPTSLLRDESNLSKTVDKGVYNLNRTRGNLTNYGELSPQGTFDKFIKDIQQNGITSPIVIDIGKDGKIIVADGSHRLLVAEELRLDNVPVTIRKNGSKSTKLKKIREEANKKTLPLKTN